MDKALLVNVDFAAGQALIDALDAADLRIQVAMWAFFPEYGEWMFLLASRRLDEHKRAAAYGVVHDALGLAGMSRENTPPLIIMRMTDPFIRALRRTFKKANSVAGMRLGMQRIGDRYLDDAIVYRIE